MPDIQIVARVKPHFKSNEGPSCIKTTDNTVEVTTSQSAYCGNYKVKHNYAFDTVFDDTYLNENIYNKFSIDILKSLIHDQLEQNLLKYIDQVNFGNIQ